MAQYRQGDQTPRPDGEGACVCTGALVRLCRWTVTAMGLVLVVAIGVVGRYHTDLGVLGAAAGGCALMAALALGSSIVLCSACATESRQERGR